MKPHFGQSDAAMNKLAGCNSFPNGDVVHNQKVLDGLKTVESLEVQAKNAGYETPFEYLAATRDIINRDKTKPKRISPISYENGFEDGYEKAKKEYSVSMSGEMYVTEDEYMTPEPLPKGYFGHEDGCDCAVCDDIAMRNERISLVSNSEAATTIADIRAKYDIETRRGDRLSELLKKQTRLNAQILTQIGAGKEDLAEFIARHDRYQSALHIIAYMGISGLSWQYDFEKCVNIAKEALGVKQ